MSPNSKACHPKAVLLRHAGNSNAFNTCCHGSVQLAILAIFLRGATSQRASSHEKIEKRMPAFTCEDLYLKTRNQIYVCVILSTRGRQLRHRAMFDDWSLQVSRPSSQLVDEIGARLQRHTVTRRHTHDVGDAPEQGRFGGEVGNTTHKPRKLFITRKTPH